MRFISPALKVLTNIAATCTFILVNLITLHSQSNSNHCLLTYKEFFCDENYLPISRLTFLKVSISVIVILLHYQHVQIIKPQIITMLSSSVSPSI